jgi:hypothetical protein
MSETIKNPARTMTDSEFGTVKDALASILAVLSAGDMGDGTTLPSDVEKLDEKTLGALCARTFHAVLAKQGEAERAIKVAAKKAIDAKMHVLRVATVEAYREIAALSPTVKAMIGDKANAPTQALLPVSEVVSFFPEGSTEETVLPLLHKMGYKLQPGASKDRVKRVIVHIGADFVAKQLSGASV